MRKPGRPLGLVIAIIASTMLFTFLPLAQVAFYGSLMLRFRDVEFTESGGISGGDVLGVDMGDLALPAILALIFLIVAVLAWRGRQWWARYLYMAAVLLLTLLTIISTIVSQNRTQGVNDLFDSASAFAASLVQARLIITLLVAIYVIWYVNRGPARAFYRGYYLTEKEPQGELQ